jgi:hypothetical protein
MLNVSREVFGLLGITVLGAILSNREHAASGAELHRYLVGDQFSLVVAAIVIAVGAPLAWFTLRGTRAETPAVAPEPVLETA